MGQVFKIGKYLFALPMAFFGISHFMNAEMMSSMAPGGTIMVYITGLALIAAAVSIIIGKYDKLACLLLAIFLLLTALMIHAPGLGSEDAAVMQASTANMLKDLALSGGALGYGLLAKDNSVIG